MSSVYIQPQYHYDPNGFAVAIVEMNENVEFDEYRQPANLPPIPLNINDGSHSITIAASHRTANRRAITRKMDVHPFTPEACALFNPGEPSTEIMCIDFETECHSQGNADCNLCEVRF